MMNLNEASEELKAKVNALSVADQAAYLICMDEIARALVKAGPAAGMLALSDVGVSIARLVAEEVALGTLQ